MIFIKRKDGKEITFHNPIYLIATQFLKLYLVVGFLLRLLLALTLPAQTVSLSFLEILRMLAVGFLSDLGTGILLTLPLVVLYLGLNEWKYEKKAGWIIEGLWLAGFVYIWCFHSVFDDYGGGAPKIAKAFVTWKLMSFSLRFFIPRIRRSWRRVSLYLAWGVYVFLLLGVTLGEYFFWQEFGVRFNFIAVDYLVYTHEVIGNIMESYAVIPLLSGALLLTVGLILWPSRHYRLKLDRLYHPGLLASQLGIYAVLCLIGFFLVSGTYRLQSDDQYVTQLEQNGSYDFLMAFRNNQLEYDRFYALLPERECKVRYRKAAGLNRNGIKRLGYGGQPRKLNVVLITVESLSADFLSQYGNRQHLTPSLDRLMSKSLVFDRLYAAGNRTVRGLEALSLCVPPTAGESIIKQKRNAMGDLSVGTVLRRQGYQVQFLYGGDSYFDNMGNFFSRNGYEVIDRSQIEKREVTFSNIWGVCDEDIFHKGIQVFNEDAHRGRPFFAQIMTTSNHRPYTYPEGRVPGNPHTREGAVRYTDYAIGHFLQEAAGKFWFSHTVFIIIADHCASSAGKTSLPVDRYHIPCIIYSPGNIAPHHVSTLCSQIDVMPTLFSLLHLPCQVRFTGQDILSRSFVPRAFMATYQDLGYLEGNRLTVLSPVRKINQYLLRPSRQGRTTDEILQKHLDWKMVKTAQAYYQYVNLYLKKY